MKVIIAGSRGINDMRLVLEAMERSGFQPTEIVSGGAWGVDKLGEAWALGRGIPVRQFIPDWNGYAGKRAGFVRNTKMAEYADALVAIWDGQSMGTRHMITTMISIPKEVYVHRLDKPWHNKADMHNARLPRSDE